jgi:hypothetical protein
MQFIKILFTKSTFKPAIKWYHFTPDLFVRSTSQESKDAYHVFTSSKQYCFMRKSFIPLRSLAVLQALVDLVNKKTMFGLRRRPRPVEYIHLDNISQLKIER